MPIRAALSLYTGQMPCFVVPWGAPPRAASSSSSITMWCGKIRCARSSSHSRPTVGIPTRSTSSTSASSTSGLTTTPGPITHCAAGWKIPDGSRCSANVPCSFWIVCPALLPPL